jgi:hypothetical protein
MLLAVACAHARVTGGNTAAKAPKEGTMQITKTVQTDELDIKAFAYESKRGKYAGQPRVSVKLSVGDLVATAALAKLLAAENVSISVSPDQAREIARKVPAAREALAAAGIKARSNGKAA